MLLVISLTTEMPRYYEIKHDSHECGWWGRGKNWFNSPINTMGLNGGVHKDTVPWIPCICMGITWTLITESVLWYTMRGYEHYEHYNLQSQSSFHSIYLYAPKMNFCYTEREWALQSTRTQSFEHHIFVFPNWTLLNWEGKTMHMMLALGECSLVHNVPYYI